MPYQLAGIRGQGGMAQITETAKGTSSFMSYMKPSGIRAGSAKDLMLKDADYSTPTDHYFSYLGKVKSGEIVKTEQEKHVLSKLDLDQTALARMVAENSEREPTFVEMFQSLPHDRKVALAAKRGLKEDEFHKIVRVLEFDDSRKEFVRTKRDAKILENATVGALLDIQGTKKKVKQFTPDFESEDMVKLAPKKTEKVSRKERLRRQKERENELKNVLAGDNTDVDQMVKVAQEGGEIQAKEVTTRDLKKLQKLRDRAKEQPEIVGEGAFE